MVQEETRTFRGSLSQSEVPNSAMHLGVHVLRFNKGQTGGPQTVPPWDARRRRETRRLVSERSAG